MGTTGLYTQLFLDSEEISIQILTDDLFPQQSETHYFCRKDREKDQAQCGQKAGGGERVGLILQGLGRSWKRKRRVPQPNVDWELMC